MIRIIRNESELRAWADGHLDAPDADMLVDLITDDDHPKYGTDWGWYLSLVDIPASLVAGAVVDCSRHRRWEGSHL